jgi:hypothetical protein
MKQDPYTWTLTRDLLALGLDTRPKRIGSRSWIHYTWVLKQDKLPLGLDKWTHYPWVWTLDQLPLGPDAGPITLGS